MPLSHHRVQGWTALQSATTRISIRTTERSYILWRAILTGLRPRYLMGVGYERDLVDAVRSGVDMFDCVLPTRNGRNGGAFTSQGRIQIRNARFREDLEVIEPGCDCTACVGGFSRAYLRHLFTAGEMLGPILLSLHNIRHFERLMVDIRAAIRDDAWSSLARAWPVLDEGLVEAPGTCGEDLADATTRSAD